jgi:hypothetical protein
MTAEQMTAAHYLAFKEKLVPREGEAVSGARHMFFRGMGCLGGWVGHSAGLRGSGGEWSGGVGGVCVWWWGTQEGG